MSAVEIFKSLRPLCSDWQNEDLRVPTVILTHKFPTTRLDRVYVNGRHGHR